MKNLTPILAIIILLIAPILRADQYEEPDALSTEFVQQTVADYWSETGSPPEDGWPGMDEGQYQPNSWDADLTQLSMEEYWEWAATNYPGDEEELLHTITEWQGSATEYYPNETDPGFTEEEYWEENFPEYEVNEPEDPYATEPVYTEEYYEEEDQYEEEVEGPCDDGNRLFPSSLSLNSKFAILQKYINEYWDYQGVAPHDGIVELMVNPDTDQMTFYRDDLDMVNLNIFSFGTWSEERIKCEKDLFAMVLFLRLNNPLPNKKTKGCDNQITIPEEQLDLMWKAWIESFNPIHTTSPTEIFEFGGNFIYRPENGKSKLLEDVYTSKSGVSIDSRRFKMPDKNFQEKVAGTYHTHPYYNQTDKIWYIGSPPSGNDYSYFASEQQWFKDNINLLGGELESMVIFSPPVMWSVQTQGIPVADKARLNEFIRQRAGGRNILDQSLVRFEANKSFAIRFQAAKQLGQLGPLSTVESLLISRQVVSSHKFCLYRSVAKFDTINLAVGESMQDVVKKSKILDRAQEKLWLNSSSQGAFKKGLVIKGMKNVPVPIKRDSMVPEMTLVSYPGWR